MNDGVKVSPLKLIGQNDDGSTFGLSSKSTGEFLLAFRNAGTISGKHFHKGLSFQKIPEVFILIEGELELYYKNLKTSVEKCITVKAPAKVDVYPYIWHEIKALTTITFLELCSLKEHEQDTFYKY